MALTTAGINFLAGAVIGDGTPFNYSNAYLGVGNGSGAFDVSQTDLMGDSTIRKAMDTGWPVLNAPTVKFRSTFINDEANFDWHEWGIFNSATGGVMLSRVVESNGTKQDNQTWVLEVAVTFTIGA